MDQQQQDFARRLGRIDGSGQAEIHVGPAQTQAMGRYRRLSEMVERNRQLTGGYSSGAPSLQLTVVLSWALALSMGCLAGFLARYLRFQVSGNPVNVTPSIELALDVIVAIFIAFLLREALSLSAVKRMGAQFAGILLAMFTMHNVVHAMPQTFEGLFSPNWVQHVTTQTEAGTLNILGNVYRI